MADNANTTNLTNTHRSSTVVEDGKQIGVTKYNPYSASATINDPISGSRLWLGVPQLTEDQMKMFEAAYTGHQFFFVLQMPKWMVSGEDKYKIHANNVKAILEKCCMGFNGLSDIEVGYADQDDGGGRKLSHMTNVTKTQNDVSFTLHEFAGLPLKNGIQTWVEGTIDPITKRGHYMGKVGQVPGGWCLANHTMTMLVVQVDPSWREIQEAVLLTNMFPTEVPFGHMNYTKGDPGIVEDYDITFKCNEIRNAQVMELAVTMMQSRILNFISEFRTDDVEPGAFDSRKFAYFTNTGENLGANFTDDDTYKGTILSQSEQTAAGMEDTSTTKPVVTDTADQTGAGA